MSCASEFRVHRYQPFARPFDRFGVLWEIRKARYDAVLDFEQISLPVAAFLRATGIRVRVGFVASSRDQRGALRTNCVTLREKDSMWRSFLRLTQMFYPALSDNAEIEALPCSDVQMRQFDEWWRNTVLPISSARVAFHLGTGPWAAYRRWPVERFVALAKMLAERASGLLIILVGTDADKPLISEFSRLYAGRLLDASHLGSIQQAALLLSRCNAMIGADSGVMHLAAAMGVPTFGLFGPASPQQWAPVGPRATYLYRTQLPCSPCIDTYQGVSPEECTNRTKRKCMLDISALSVLNAVMGLAPFRSDAAQESCRNQVRPFA